MTSEAALGTARVDIVVDTSQFDSAITAAKRSVSGMSQAAQAEYNKLGTAEKRRVDSLIQQADKLKLTKEQQIAYNAALKGVPSHILDELKVKLAAGQQATAGMAKSAKELNFALRGVPAQFTDIATSLASGQKPMLVLLQQGGQLKDTFGGIGPAAKALGGYIAGLINPVTLLAGALVAVGVAWKQGSDEGLAFQRSIALTGNAAGVTTAQLQAMAAQIDATSSATTHSAAAALATVANTGKFTGDQLRQVAEAALALETATGRSIEKTVADFASLKDDPLDAILKLNGAIGDGTNVIRFLTPEQLTLIRNLQESGRSADAAAIAIRAYADAIASRAPEVVRNLGAIETTWKIIKDTAREAWDAMLGIGRDQTVVERIRGLQDQIGRAVARGFPTEALEAQLKALQAKAAEAGKAPTASGGNGSVDSGLAKEALAFKDRYLTREETKKRAIAELDRLRSFYTKQEYDILRKGIEERFKPAKGAKGPDLESATNRSNLQAIKDQAAVEQAAIANTTQILQAKYSARLVTVSEYYSELKRLSGEAAASEEKSIQAQLAVLNARDVKGKKDIDTTREIATLEAQLAKLRADNSTKQTILAIQEADALNQRTQATKAYADALTDANHAIQLQMDSMVARIGMGDREFEIQSRINQAYERGAKELLELTRAQEGANRLDPAAFEERKRQLAASVEEEIRIVRDGYDRMAEAQANWKNGAVKAYQDYADKAADVAGQTRELFSNAFQGLEDVLTDFVTKGKADFKGFLDSIAADITRFIIRQQLSKWLTQLGSLFGGGGFGGSGGALTFGDLLESANGNVFSGGNVVPFARGGVVERESLFRMANGRMASMSEGNKPEAIMPLERGPDGKLGVKASGGASVINLGGIHFYGPATRENAQYAANESARKIQRAARG